MRKIVIDNLVDIYKMIPNMFMLNLHKDLVEKGVSESTAKLYVRNLYTLNNQQNFKNLAFLKRYDEINSKLKPYAKTTQKTFIGSINSVLHLVKHKRSYSKTFQHYQKLMKDRMVEEVENQSDNQSKMKNNWLSWEEVEDKRSTLAKEFENPPKRISAEQYEQLLKYMVVCLFTLLKPRRNKDYQECVVVKTEPTNQNIEHNYYCMNDKKFIFNNYKTAKTYGQQIIDISGNDEMIKVMDLYLKYHPLRPRRMTKKTEFPLLVKFNGEKLSSVNSITRILNKVFSPKQIGASMLRHIYLTGKYGSTQEEMKEDSEQMAHSMDTQKKYICDIKDNEATNTETTERVSTGE